MACVAVTGASGLVGRHLVPLLIQEGHQVRGLARSAHTGAEHGLAAGFEFLKGDVRDPVIVRRLLDSADYVVHMAASLSPEDRTEDIIMRGTETVLTAAKEAEVKRLVFLSCLGVHAASESPFMEAKWKAESTIRGSEVSFTILRASVILGRGALRPLAELIRSWPVIPIPGHGRHRLQPVDVVDVARCIAISLTSEAMENEMISVGGPMFITVRQLVDLIQGELGTEKAKLLVPVGFLPAVARSLPADSRRFFAEPGLARLRHGVVASPGIVQREFGFQASPVVPGIAGYVA